jgi:hypothetical protein
MSYNFNALLSACKQGDLDRAKHLAKTPVNIHTDNDKLIKILCDKNNFDIILWLFELAEQLHDPYDFNGLLVEFMVSGKDDRFITNFIECVSKFNDRHNVNEIKIPISEDIQMIINNEIKINDKIEIPVNEVKVTNHSMSNDEIEEFLEKFTKKMESTSKAIDEFYDQIVEKQNLQFQCETTDDDEEKNGGDQLVELEEEDISYEDMPNVRGDEYWYKNYPNGDEYNDIPKIKRMTGKDTIYSRNLYEECWSHKNNSQADSISVESESKPKEMVSIEKDEYDEFYNLKHAKEMRKIVLKTIDEIAIMIEYKTVKGYCEYPITNEQHKYFNELKQILEKHGYTVEYKEGYSENVIYVEW